MVEQAPVLGAVLLAALLLASSGCGRASAPAPPRQQQRSTAASPPSRNPIVRQLRAPAGLEREEGVAVAVLVDVSGSMKDSVPDERGQSRPKIDIARDCVGRLVDQVAAYVEGHPDQTVLLGLYEFSTRRRQPSCRPLVPMGPADATRATAALQSMRADGGTPIGDAMIKAKQDLDATGMKKMHLLVVTDGENTQGYRPQDVAEAMNRIDQADRPAIYLIAFDVGAELFDPVRDAGGMVLAASGGAELTRTLDFVLTGRILAEQPGS